MTKFNHVQSQDLSVHQDDAAFRCHSPGLLLVPFQIVAGKNNEKGLQQTMRVKRNV